MGRRISELPATAVLAAIVAFALSLRVLAVLVLDQPVETGDGLAYITMARTLAEQGVITDNFGQHAFFSAGYPLLLTPFFALLGGSPTVVLAVNMLLAAASIRLVFELGRALAERADAGLLAALAYAAWLPAIWNATLAAKENLSTPLLLALALCAVRIARGRRPLAGALIAGPVWGAALVTGSSALPLCAGLAVAAIVLWRSSGKPGQALAALALFLAGAAVTVSPWLHATDRMVGEPVLTTNAAFNLYLGNNPAATGRFVSIADTPLGEDWEETRLRLGEIGNARRLERAAIAWISENPAAAAGLAARKLAYFWQPNVPDAADFESSRAVAAIRTFEVAQYALILLLALWGFCRPAIASRDKWILAAMIVGFWLLHAAAYVIVRYRDPVVPLLIVVASVQVAEWLRRRSPASGGLAHAA